MTLVSDIIRDAYRESNLIAIGTEPSGAQSEEALKLFNRFIASVYGNEAGEPLQPFIVGKKNIERPQGYPWYDPVPYAGQWFVPKNVRLILNLTSPLTVYLDPNPEDGQRFAIQDKAGNLGTNNLTIEGNGRTIVGQDSYTANTNDVNVQFFYEANSGDWRIVSPLKETDIFPFSSEFEDMFVIGLALRLNPRNDIMLDQQSMEVFKRAYRQFTARYSQSIETGSELGLIDRNRLYWYVDPTAEFNTGVNFRDRFRW